MAPDSLELRNRLHLLFQQATGPAAIKAEMARARRLFLGADTSGSDPTEAAVTRFSEWFLLERESDIWGQTPRDHFTGGGDALPTDLPDSRAGVFIVEAHTDDFLRVRDLYDSSRCELTGVPSRLRPGDILIGRLYAVDDGGFVPSAAVAILGAMPAVAVAIRKDFETFGSQKRLTQIELEHLFFHRFDALGDVPQGPPLERLEADLQSVIERADLGDQYEAAGLSSALRATPHPGTVMGPFLELVAFESDVDLDDLRRLLLEIHNSPSPPATAEPDPSPDVPQPPAFDDKVGEPLGARLARRIEFGLDHSESVEGLFADVEEMLGEPIDEHDDSDDSDLGDPGDLAALVREYAWENKVTNTDEAQLQRFVAIQRALAVPRLELEHLVADDVLRFLLEAWISNPPKRRVAVVQQAFELVGHFFEWATSTQGFPLEDVQRECRARLIDDLPRLQQASLALSTSDQPTADDVAQAEMVEITRLEHNRVWIAPIDSGADQAIDLAPESASWLREQDICIAGVDRRATTPAFRGVVLVVPAQLRALLGS